MVYFGGAGGSFGIFDRLFIAAHFDHVVAGLTHGGYQIGVGSQSRHVVDSRLFIGKIDVDRYHTLHLFQAALNRIRGMAQVMPMMGSSNVAVGIW